MHPRQPVTPAPLDKWDIAFIRYFKSSRPTQTGVLLAIWSERCGVEASHPHLAHIVEYLANLIDRLGLTPDLFTIMRDMAPEESWRFGLSDGIGYPEREIHVMASWLRLTEVKYLPGYREALDAEKALTDAPGRAKLLAP